MTCQGHMLEPGRVEISPALNGLCSETEERVTSERCCQGTDAPALAWQPPDRAVNGSRPEAEETGQRPETGGGSSCCMSSGAGLRLTRDLEPQGSGAEARST